jgi:quercetin dioxygenase-like cupin family protein
VCPPQSLPQNLSQKIPDSERKKDETLKFAKLADLPDQSVSHNPQIIKKVMLRQGDLPHLMYFSQARFAPGQQAAAHSHADMSEVFLVEAGEGVIRVDGKPYPLQVGTCVTVEPGEQHELLNTGNVDLVLTYFGLVT